MYVEMHYGSVNVIHKQFGEGNIIEGGDKSVKYTLENNYPNQYNMRKAVK